MSNAGRRLRESNEEILKYISQLREQRNELGILVDKQRIEKSHLEAEMARISYKLSLINKSLNQRLRALIVYDETLAHIESKYKGLADSTLVLLAQVRKESTNLESTIDKKIGTENDCLDCPRCDISTYDYKAAAVSCNKIHVNPKETPIKQSVDSDRRFSRNGPMSSPIRSARPSTNPDHILYTRAMEYPMLLSPMMEKEQYEKLITELQRQVIPSHRVSSTRTNSTISTRDNLPETVTEDLVVEEQIKVSNRSNATSSTKISDTNTSDQKSQPVSYTDVDLPDMEPNKEVLEERNIVVEEYASPSKTPDSMKQSPSPSPYDISETSNMSEKHPDITEDARQSLESRKQNNNNEVSNKTEKKLVKSNINNELNTIKTKIENNGESNANTTKKNHSGVEVFRQGYKSQHEKTEEPYVHRHKRSIYNNKDFSFTIKK
ncbi:hypothetical protein WA026_019858 [Henosepilachna vigintioctopunctata]|uniref:Uncharacterized protein n=1 Tax=Henosepilachna vigintioctopunctata TaxID=420089 RepID=A0AAW1VF99_9CUCU